ncbi:SDR family NAD(P)-dependent oxidoreductase [Pseudocitrobacter vendiensis]|uniref:SDR family oxidoreductase n=1 Tax=Pseudocitrobacter vendiensis TaxID=2488306 RepID=A0ABN8TEF8_9ENTR|nr:SDR family oxidoreductase [Pseudocitrobacter vendiensis]CAH6661223.1 SDR family oxidoreductase [Pseudocitrobacter vendiensis]
MKNVKVVLITGALSGIGKATAELFANKGYKLVISGRRQSAGEELEKQLQKINPLTRYKNADMSNEEDIKALIDFTVAEFGSLDIAINAAGLEGIQQSIVDVTMDNIKSVFDTNVYGVAIAMKYEVAAMLSARSGSIVNVSSVAGHKGMPNSSVYAASKHAVEGFTKSVALEVAAQGIRINAVAPGPVETPMLDRFVGNDKEAKNAFIQSLPFKKASTTEEIAKTILFIADSEVDTLVGQIVTVDSGFTA